MTTTFLPGWLRKCDKVLRFIIVPITFSVAVFSLSLPYILRSNIHSGPPVPLTTQGVHLFPPFIVLTMLSIGMIVFYSSRKIGTSIFACVLAFLTCALLQLVRMEIHFQGFIDHDFDTRSGIGFYFLVISIVLFFVVSGVNVFLSFKLNSTKKINNELLDQ